MDKGTRVRVVKGRKHKDAVGTVFWQGPDRYKEGATRLGLHGDDGETIWVREDYCEELDPSDPAFAPPEVELPEKGARVQWTRGDEVGFGTVFWAGDGKGGPRVGVTDAVTEEPLWFDVRQISPAPELDAVEAPGDGGGDDEEIPF